MSDTFELYKFPCDGCGFRPTSCEETNIHIQVCQPKKFVCKLVHGVLYDEENNLRLDISGPASKDCDEDVFTPSVEYPPYVPVQENVCVNEIQNSEYNNGTILTISNIPETNDGASSSVSIEKNIFYKIMESQQSERTILNDHIGEYTLNYICGPGDPIQENGRCEILGESYVYEIVQNNVLEQDICNDANIVSNNVEYDQNNSLIYENSNYVVNQNYTDNYDGEFQRSKIYSNEQNNEVMDVANSYDDFVNNNPSVDDCIRDEMLYNISDHAPTVRADTNYKGVSDNLICAQFGNDVPDDNCIKGVDITFQYNIVHQFATLERDITVNKCGECPDAVISNYTTQEVTDEIERMNFDIKEVLNLELNNCDMPICSGYGDHTSINNCYNCVNNDSEMNANIQDMEMVVEASCPDIELNNNNNQKNGYYPNNNGIITCVQGQEPIDYDLPMEKENEKELVFEFIKEKSSLFQQVDGISLQSEINSPTQMTPINYSDRRTENNRFHYEFESNDTQNADTTNGNPFPIYTEAQTSLNCGAADGEQNYVGTIFYDSQSSDVSRISAGDCGELSQNDAGAQFTPKTVKENVLINSGEQFPKCVVQNLPYNENAFVENVDTDIPFLNDFDHQQAMYEDDIEINDVDDNPPELMRFQNMMIFNINVAPPLASVGMGPIVPEPDFFKCDICEFSTGCEREIAWHKLQHANNVPCRCSKCNITDPVIDYARQHHGFRADCCCPYFAHSDAHHRTQRGTDAQAQSNRNIRKRA